MTNSAQQSAIERIHASGKQLVLAVTGGGSGAISALLQVPGASASVLEAVVPYAATAMEEWLGGTPDQFCSERTARAMAMAAFERARSLSNSATADPNALRGIGATASLASNRPKRGEHRVHVAWQSATTTVVESVELSKGELSRADEEQIATRLVLSAVAEACDIESPELSNTAIQLTVDRREQHALPEWSELLLGEREVLAISDEQTINAKILFPGAFNPLHFGHTRMAELASSRYGAPVTFELSILNVDKPPLDFIELAARLEQLAGRSVLVTRAPTFVAKSQLVPGCVFVVGVDTVERIGEPKYYGGDVARRDAALASIADQGCRFLVFGRVNAGRFETLADVELPAALRALCDEVPEAEFRSDVSSTELRK